MDYLGSESKLRESVSLLPMLQQNSPPPFGSTRFYLKKSKTNRAVATLIGEPSDTVYQHAVSS